MPIYEYRCTTCGKTFEVFAKMSDADPETCEHCGAATIEKVLHAAAIHYKGSGFYATDYGSKRRGATASGGEGSGSGGSSGDGGGSSSGGDGGSGSSSSSGGSDSGSSSSSGGSSSGGTASSSGGSSD